MIVFIMVVKYIFQTKKNIICVNPIGLSVQSKRSSNVKGQGGAEQGNAEQVL